MHKTNKPYFILETAAHHEGDIEFLKTLIDSFSVIDANAIKFHFLFDVDDYMVPNHPAKEVVNNLSIHQSCYDEIFNAVERQNKSIIALCNDVESLRWINSLQNEHDIVGVELHSTGLNDLFLLQEAVNFNKTIILGVGGSTFDEIQYAVDFLKNNSKHDILLVHGFQSYPTDYSDINFKRVALLKQAFGLPVAYADHTDPADNNNILVSVLPQVLGVNILEKHVTNVFGQKRIDSQAAVSVETMKEIISLARQVHKTVGNNSMQFSDAEKSYGDTGPMKKAIVARHDIEEGTEITLADIAFKRTPVSSPIAQKDILKIVGCKAAKNIAKNEFITYGNIHYEFKKSDFSQFYASSKD